MNLPDIPLTVDRNLPPGTVLVRSGGEQGICADSATLRLQARTAVSPALAEDCISLLESSLYFIRYQEGSPPITCECCGTSVTAVPEAAATPERPRRWQQGIWEAETWRRHTLRRCESIRKTMRRPR